MRQLSCKILIYHPHTICYINGDATENNIMLISQRKYTKLFGNT